MNLFNGFTDDSGVQWEKNKWGRNNENEKVVSDGSHMFHMAGTFKEFITITEKALALEWKLIKVS